MALFLFSVFLFLLINLEKIIYLNYVHGDFPGGPVAKTPSSQCRGPGFDTWSGNWIPHATTKIEHATTETQHSQINTD